MKGDELSTIHLAYPTPPSKLGRTIDSLLARFSIPRSNSLCRWPLPTHAPYSISKALITHASQSTKVKLYDWYDRSPIKCSKNDFFLFHPVPDLAETPKDERKWTKHNNTTIGAKTLALKAPPLAAILIPYTSDSDGWLLDLIEQVNGKVFILGGEIWEKHWKEKSPYRVVSPTPQRLDMGIDCKEYPYVRSNFNPVGIRRLLYIGHTAQYKNPEALEALAELLPEIECSHIGFGELKGWRKLAQDVRFTPQVASEIINSHDLFISCSRADAQATTILEQMAFGTPVLATSESGYSDLPLKNLSISDHNYNASLVREVLSAKEESLHDISQKQRHLAESKYTWDNFCSKILKQVEIWGADRGHPVINNHRNLPSVSSESSVVKP